MKTATILIALLFATAAANAATITVVANTAVTGGKQYTSSTGALLSGDLGTIGTFDTSGSNLLTLQTSNDFATVNALFKPLGENAGVGSGSETGVGQTAGTGLKINNTPTTGDIFAQLTGATNTYVAQNTLLYAWVFNASTTGAATEWGIFTATTGWNMPNDVGSETLGSEEVNSIIRGSSTSTTLRLANVVPEPSVASLSLVGALLGLVRRRRR